MVLEDHLGRREVPEPFFVDISFSQIGGDNAVKRVEKLGPRLNLRYTLASFVDRGPTAGQVGET